MIDPFEVVKNLAYAIVGVGGAITLVILIIKALKALSEGATQAFVGGLMFALVIMLFTQGKTSLKLLQDLGDGLASAIGLK